MARACAGDPELRREVESLLASAGSAVSFLETPACPLHADSDETLPLPWKDGRGEESLPDEAGEGRRVGPYRIQRLLGHGGMGTVYLAVRVDEFEKLVAIKILKRGLGTKEVVRRFRHERQILAGLEHPNIAQIFDGGTTEEELPYFVMEYVEGEPIDRYCERYRLSIRERLELFRKVCSAVHQAHQHLIVHRDIKPGNILVGAEGEPKLLDFGIAKPLDASASSSSVLTASGIRPMTLKYASPEQIEGETITTASDVYSLGVVLYELLTGRWPYPAQGDKWLDLANAIRQRPPRRPSTAIDLTTPEPPTTAGAETSNRRSLKRRLTGDLDSILLTALAKRPEHRYPSVEQLSADVGRHLAGSPIHARKHTFAYWAGKLLRRHKLEAALAALVLAAILAFSAVTIHLWNRALLERERAEEVADFLVELFQAPSPDEAKGEEITARQILDRGKQHIREYRGSQPRLYARLASTMAEVYYRLGHYRAAQALLEDALSDLRDHLGGEADPQLARVINDLAVMFWAQGRFSEAETHFQESLAMLIEVHGDDAAELLDTLNNLGTLARERGTLEETEGYYRRALAILEKVVPPMPQQVAMSRFLLGTLLLESDSEAAEALLRQALATRIQLFGSENTSVAFALNNLGISLQAQGRSAESETTYREALEIRTRLLGERHPDVAATQVNLASLLVSVGEFEAAERLGREALESLKESKPGHWRIAHADRVLGSCLAATGRFEEAEPLLVESYPILEKARHSCTRYTLDALLRLIDLYDAWGREKETGAYRALWEACETHPIPTRGR